MLRLHHLVVYRYYQCSCVLTTKSGTLDRPTSVVPRSDRLRLCSMRANYGTTYLVWGVNDEFTGPSNRAGKLNTLSYRL